MNIYTGGIGVGMLLDADNLETIKGLNIAGFWFDY